MSYLKWPNIGYIVHMMCIISRKELAVHNRYIVLMENINAKASRLQPNYYYFP